MKKKIYIVACAVLAVDIRRMADELGFDCETRFLEAGLHNNPKLLQTRLQAAIDEISAKNDGERIIVGYGVCGKGTIGVRAHGTPLVIPKVHDCISLFLGGDRAYKEQFWKNPGTYYLSSGWCDENFEPMSERRQRAWFGSEEFRFDDLVKTHGEKTAVTTFEFLNTWQKNYKRVVFIETGAKKSGTYEAYAKEMAREYNWEYEKIQGDPGLIRKLLAADKSTREILLVPPEHVIEFDAITSTLSAHPVWADRAVSKESESLVVQLSGEASEQAPMIRYGLGIDAGGTYTDAVIYDLKEKTTITKAKALTTRWDFTVGIDNALKHLDQAHLGAVELVALSTTLATNAIVENEGQKTGMILMPPMGQADNIDYAPKAVIKGALDISGREKESIDPDQVRRIADKMAKTQDVTAFAVSGYGGAINPAHELAVKEIIQAHTGCFVSCGHELSDTLNFKTRAVTAMFNARIIPRLKSLLTDLENVMKDFSIKAPVVVVKGDGTLMSSHLAKQRPVETVLSGPAASVAGARHLTGLADALVVDMGGTTTDTAALCDGQVSLNEKGSTVGGRRTHVKALEIRTEGLGGDSLIAFQAGMFTLGPRRVAPVSWIAHTQPTIEKALGYLGSNLNRFSASTRKMQIVALTGSRKRLSFTPMEEKILGLLQERPLSLDELVIKTGVYTDKTLPLDRLEENFLIQRCGLTPTDLLHITGQFVKWDTPAARKMAQFFADLCGKETTGLISDLLDMCTRRLATELLKRQLDDQVNPEGLDTCPVCRIMMDNLLEEKSKDFKVSVTLNRPVIGIGAPIKFFLPRAVRYLGTQAVLPENADVANAIGAITSNVSIKKQLRIIPGTMGGFTVEGVANSPGFVDFQGADLFAREALARIIRERAREAGSSATRVDIQVQDQLSHTTSGGVLFLGRILKGSLTGRPDLVINGE